MTEIEKRILAEADLMLVPQKIRPFDDPALLPENRGYVMASGGIARTKKGRLWILWAGGGDNWDAYLMMAHSDDNGEHFSSPDFLLSGPMTPGGLHTCIIEGNLFVSPDGNLHLFYCQRLGFMDGRMGAWHAVCRNPDDAHPVWETPERIADGSILDKPVILQDGRWLLEISIWPAVSLVLGEGLVQRDTGFWDGKLSAPRGANIYLSSDCGKTWVYQGSAHPADRECDEPRIIQRKDSSLLMLLRNQKGLAWTQSSDLGKTWSDSVPAEFPAPTSRTVLLTLPDSRILLIRNVPLEETVKNWDPARGFTPGRERLTAFLSDDEGRTWSEGLLIDGRSDVSYPDAVLATDGTIHLIYDYKRTKGELMYARFTVRDIEEKNPVVPKVLFAGYKDSEKGGFYAEKN